MQAEIAEVAHGHLDETGHHKLGHTHRGGETAHPHRVQTSEGEAMKYPVNGWLPGPAPSSAVARLVEGERAAEATLEVARADLFAEDGFAELKSWLDRFFGGVTDMAVMKAMEYGSGDLTVMAAGMEQIIQVPEQITAEEKWAFLVEAALAFYALGKIGRTFSAFKAGKLPNADNYIDLSAYAAMAARVREMGRWT